MLITLSLLWALRSSRPLLRWLLAAALLAGLVGGWPDSNEARAAQPEFVGSQACASCHLREHQAWQSSQHAQAMQHASAATVLGNFDDARFTYAGVETRFYQRDGRYFVYTDGPDGQLAEFEIRYTFGVEPLQQYLVEFPDGRLQALSIAWDSRPASAGGQRWFHLYPDAEVDHRDPLHWTRPAQNWNHMCADCHSTNLRKGYDSSRDRFATRWAEISVGCEACHGPGSAHLQWARQGAGGEAHKGLTLLLDERKGISWRRSLEQLTAHRESPLESRKEQQVCAQCHSRRLQVAEGYHAGKPLADHYLPALLEPGLYYPDGQQREEVFVSASFEQSRMHAAGVTCSDCHEPHSQQLRVQGNALCTQCHAQSHYDSPRHHFHDEASPGAQCVSCHMPETTYMVIDPRRDHSLRIPRPDLSASLDTPNACNQCHADRSTAWAAEAIRRHHPEPRQGYQQFAASWSAAERGLPGATAALARLLSDPRQPALVRASSARRLGQPDSPQALDALRQGLADPDAQVRRASLGALESLPAARRVQWIAPLLSDPVRSVRAEAARLLADAPVPEELQASFASALEEYEAQLRFNADRADARTELASLRRRQGLQLAAMEQLNAALRLDPLYEPAYVELADLQRQAGDEARATALLEEGLRQRPQSALLHYALGLGLVRQQRQAEALPHLQKSHELAPTDARYGLTLALALHPGQPRQALQVLERVLKSRPHDTNLLWLAAVYSLEQGQAPRAAGYAERLLRLNPTSTKAVTLLNLARRQADGQPR